MSGFSDDLDDLRAALRADPGGFAVHLLGEPTKRSTRREMRFGTGAGSLFVKLTGPHQAVWYDHSTLVGGDMLKLAMVTQGCSFADAVDIVRRWSGLGIASTTGSAIRVRRPDPARIAAADAAAADETRRKINRARGFWLKGVPVAGTVAERYLAVTRGIDSPQAGWPADVVRFHPGERALMLAATTDAGVVQAVQLIFLDEAGRKADLPVQKRSYGPQAGACVRLPGKLPVLAAEGPETGLAAHGASGHAVWIALGGIGKLDLPNGSVVLADDDARFSPAAKALAKALAEWQAQGRQTTVVYPWPTRRFDRSDLADVALQHGAAAIRARIEQATEANRPIKRLPLKEGRAMVHAAIKRFFDHVLAHRDEPLAHGLRASTGGGKSFAARELAVPFVKALRSEGDTGSLVIAVPRHDLLEQYADGLRAIAEGLVVRSWAGRNRPDPDQPGQTMCADLPAVDAAHDAGLDVDEFACKPCVLRASCAHLRQRGQTADIWLVPHALLTSLKPKALGRIAALVIDEDPLGQFLIGADKPILLPVDSLGEARLVRRRKAMDATNANESDELAALERAVQTVLRSSFLGQLRRDDYIARGITAERADAALMLLGDTIKRPHIAPGMTHAERLAAIKAVTDTNRGLGRRKQLWVALKALLTPGGPEKSGWATLEEVVGDKETRLMVRLKGRTALRDAWNVPTFLADAGMDPRKLRAIWPSLEMVGDVAIHSPFTRVVHASDCGHSLSRYDLGDPSNPRDQVTMRRLIGRQEYARRKSRLRELHAILCREVRRYAPATTLVIGQKRVREWLQRLGMPAACILMHHNAVSGLDRGRHVRQLIVVGRTLPPPSAVEDLAEALTGAAVERLGLDENGRERWYPKVDGRQEMTGGLLHLTQVDQHPDVIAEAFRASINEGGLMQDIGRPRAVERTEASPLNIVLMTDTCPDMPVDEIISMAGLAARPNDLMLSLGGVAYGEAADAHRAYPKALGSRNTIGMALRRDERSARFPLEYTIYKGNRADLGQPPPRPSHPADGIVQVSFRRAGPGHRPAVAWVDLARVPDPQVAIERHQGPLASFVVVQPGQEEQPPAPALAVRTPRPAARPSVTSPCPAPAAPALAPPPPSPVPRDIRVEVPPPVAVPMPRPMPTQDRPMDPPDPPPRPRGTPAPAPVVCDHDDSFRRGPHLPVPLGPCEGSARARQVAHLGRAPDPWPPLLPEAGGEDGPDGEERWWSYVAAPPQWPRRV